MTEFALCETPDILRIMLIVKIIINFIKIAVPLVLIIMISLDCAKSVTADEQGIKKVFSSSKNRLICMAMVFLVPTIFSFILNFIDAKTNYESCWANATKETIEHYQVLWDEAMKEQDEQKDDNDDKPNKPSDPEKDFVSSSKDITFSYEYEPNDPNMRYALYTPSSAKNNSTTPLIVWLHGDGERGSSEGALRRSGLLATLDKWTLQGFNAYVLCPHLPTKNDYWTSAASKQKVYNLINKIIKEKKINTNKIMLVGHSHGAVGLFYIAHDKADFFSSYVVLSGYNMSVDFSGLQKEPIRGYVGTRDDEASINFMEGRFKNNFGGDKITYLEGVKHGGVPSAAFNLDKTKDGKSDLIEWMLKQNK